MPRMRLAVVATTGLLAVVAACVAATTGAVSAAPPPYVIQGDHSIGGITLYRSEMSDAVARFGEPTSTRVDNDQSCVAQWRGIGLVINFFTFDGPPCVSGGAIVLTITSRKYWRTSLGLRVGDSVARLSALYPRAALHTGSYGWNGYWLVTRHTCPLARRSGYPGLLARVSGGRVRALVVGGTVCD